MTALVITAVVIMCAQQLGLWWTMRQWRASTKLNKKLLAMVRGRELVEEPGEDVEPIL